MKTKRERINRRRLKLARAVQRATVPERPFRHGLPYIVDPNISVACAPSLLTIAVVLRDETRPIDEQILLEVLAYITDGASTFFGRDVTDALGEAVRLQQLVVSGTIHRPTKGTPQPQHPETPTPSRAQDRHRIPALAEASPTA